MLNLGTLVVLTSGAQGKENSYGPERLRRASGEVVLSLGSSLQLEIWDLWRERGGSRLAGLITHNEEW